MKRKQSPVIQKRLVDEENFAMTHPGLYRVATDVEDIFIGLTVFLGDNNAVVIGVKRLLEDGTPVIMWTSGHDLVDAFINMEAGLQAGKWRVDKRSPHYTPPGK